MNISIGQTTKGEDVELDLHVLVDTRMLIAANSGGGKSWALRLLAEKSANKVQTIIIDPEGEFVTLRENIPFVLIGDEGELPTDLSSAKLLARKLLESKASAIIDLYGLRLNDRRAYVKLFLDSLMTTPKKLWHPLLVLVDEAHIFCPERGKAESIDSVISLMSQGRKRGYCGVLSTQRLSKLHKDAAAETNNVFIGRTWLDNDQIRAGDLLGMNKAHRLQLRDLKAGEFFAFGPALSNGGVSKLKTGQVNTTHPKSGQRHNMDVPPASEAVIKLLNQMGDVPAQAQEELDYIARLEGENAGLKRDISRLQIEARNQKPEQVIRQIEKKVKVPILEDRHISILQNQIAQVDKSSEKLSEIAIQLKSVVNTNLENSQSVATINSVPQAEKPVQQKQPVLSSVHQNNNSNSELGKGTRLILTALAQYYPESLDKQRLAVLTGYAVRGGAFNNYLGNCNSNNWLSKSGDIYTITDFGLAALGDFIPLPRGIELQQYWINKLGKGPKSILQTLCDIFPAEIDKESLANATNYEVSGGAFNNYLGKLRTLQLIEGSQILKAKDTLFEI